MAWAEGKWPRLHVPSHRPARLRTSQGAIGPCRGTSYRRQTRGSLPHGGTAASRYLAALSSMTAASQHCCEHPLRLWLLSARRRPRPAVLWSTSGLTIRPHRTTASVDGDMPCHISAAEARCRRAPAAEAPAAEAPEPFLGLGPPKSLQTRGHRRSDRLHLASTHMPKIPQVDVSCLLPFDRACPHVPAECATHQLSSTFQFAGRVVRSLPKRSQTWYYLVRQRRRPNGSAVAERQNRSQAPKELLLCTVTASAWMRVLKKKRVFEWCGRLATLQAELPVVVITRADGTETTD